MIMRRTKQPDSSKDNVTTLAQRSIRARLAVCLISGPLYMLGYGSMGLTRAFVLAGH